LAQQFIDFFRKIWSIAPFSGAFCKINLNQEHIRSGRQQIHFLSKAQFVACPGDYHCIDTICSFRSSIQVSEFNDSKPEFLLRHCRFRPKKQTEAALAPPPPIPYEPLLLRVKARFGSGPVDHVPPRADVIGTAVLILQVVGVLPNVETDDGVLAFHDRVVLVGRRGDVNG
jgi:hypothetical protein